jgi:zinc transport system substrate-binding protein
MSTNLGSVLAVAALTISTAMADVPNVAVDIAPVHSLVTRVMQGVGTPDLIIRSGASPHQYRLRPSEAKALQDANVVIWMGEGLTPWMEDAVATLSSEALTMSLLRKEETALLEFRESALFEEHSHDDHSDKDHDETEEHGHDEHAHGTYDPHAWLSPENAKIWLNLIAAQLSTADPENAGTYFTNAAVALTETDTLMTEVSTMLEPIRGARFIVFHDAYQYFETVFDFPASGAISLGDATDPSPARITKIQDRIKDQGVQCVLAEPQFKKGLVATVLEGTDAKTSIIDPLGIALEPGPTLYPKLIRNMAKTLVDCF